MTDQNNVDSPFYNKWIDLNHLPKATDEEFHPLEDEYLYVRLSRILIFGMLGGFMLLLFLLMTRFSLISNILILVGSGLFILVWGWITIKEFRNRGYAIREKDIAYRRGYIFQVKQYIPFRRVQHCKISEGMIDRLFDFATVIVSAAGDDIVIHGLRPEKALELQQWINEKVDQLTKEMNYEEE